MIYFFDFDTNLAQFPDDSIAMLRIAVSDFEFAVRNCGGDDECSGFDAIRNDCVSCAAQGFDAFDLNCRCARSADACAHFVEQLCQVFYFRFARRVINCRLTVRESRRLLPVSGSGSPVTCKRHRPWSRWVMVPVRGLAMI